MTTPNDLLAIALDAASAGAAVLAEGAATGFTALRTKGAVGDVVTEIDLAAERAVRAVIEARRPSDDITGEEYGSTGSGADLRWSIDPLDGTSNFVRGMPHYATSVAVQHVPSGAWLAGVVHAPELRRVYAAARGEGATLHASGTTRAISGPAPDAAPKLLAVGFSYDAAQRAGQLSLLPAQMLDYTDVRSIGSAALGLCLVAEGAVDAFTESDLYEFDWAAGALIAEEAGLVVHRPTSFRGGIVAHAPHLDGTALRIGAGR
ncbi:inositol monophosphatase family protein [Streptomyces sp. AC495_CC817]|uniref:inositol monophosphatase family protein n=1 Tax=Streptomyces sp. AC495_CC817 TaxID=2823900 RepID=UPI001C265872|nr:inositol monophosphatase family protein [Streptomyces sp. AC495_CC817]